MTKVKIKRRLGTPPPSARIAIDKDRIDRAVHRAVCEVTGGDGYGKCLYYAHAGWGLLSYLGITSYVQAGDCGVVIESGTDLCASTMGGGVLAGDFHSWLIRPLRSFHTTTYQGPKEYIDFTARHYRRYATGTQWHQGDPPNYLWTADPSDWVRFRPNRSAIDFAANPENVGVAIITTLWLSAIMAY